MPTPVGGEVHWISVAVPDSAGSQPRPRPVAAVTPAKLASAAAVRPAQARRGTSRSAKGTATTAVTFTATASPSSTPARTPQRVSTAVASPATTSPAISVSLCTPDTPCRSTSGLATPSQATRDGSVPTARASRCPYPMISTIPASATTRSTATASHHRSTPASPDSATQNGPYGDLVYHHSRGTSASQVHGR